MLTGTLGRRLGSLYAAAMTTPVQVSESRSYPVSVEETFDRLLPLPLPQLFRRRYAALPPVRATDQEGVWGTVGQERTIRLADGGTMRELLTEIDRPHRFSYRISEFTGALKPLVTQVLGSWTVDSAGTGARVTWSWELVPSGRPAQLAMPVLTRMWHGYARAALAELETLLLARTG